MNDLENILPFLALGLLYVGTGPSFSLARTLFRVFTGARFVHTLVYAVYVVPQPGTILLNSKFRFHNYKIKIGYALFQLVPCPGVSE